MESVCIESIVDDDRRKNAFELMMSPNMLIETKGGIDFTFNDFDTWAHQIGFTTSEWLPLAGPDQRSGCLKIIDSFAGNVFDTGGRGSS